MKRASASNLQNIAYLNVYIEIWTLCTKLTLGLNKIANAILIHEQCLISVKAKI